MVICGSSRRSLEKPGWRNPSPASVSKYNVYADLVVMPMSGGLLQVIASCWFGKSAYS
jgi:hypothetical protein